MPGHQHGRQRMGAEAQHAAHLAVVLDGCSHKAQRRSRTDTAGSSSTAASAAAAAATAAATACILPALVLLLLVPHVRHVQLRIQLLAGRGVLHTVTRAHCNCEGWRRTQNSMLYITQCYMWGGMCGAHVWGGMCGAN